MYENVKQWYPEEIPPTDIRICWRFYKIQINSNLADCDFEK